MSHVLAAGGAIWMGDETMRREFPPLRACWARRGDQRQVVVRVRGRTPSRELLGALNGVTGPLVRLVRDRCRTADSPAFVEQLAPVRPLVLKRVIWANAPRIIPR